ncbi:hypothetical protein JHJ32_19225 [Parapedobacter sp. ISTM3]|nr:hypothetical protein [Parapedobacter sp. ISTM3]MBK1442137.1 hypothetical protein [Parapedobacter sp. ISTM3]
MYQVLIVLHSSLRWLVLISLVVSLYRACRGYYGGAKFSKADNAIRHWTATIAHIQLMVGMTLYFQSPLTRFFMKDFHNAKERADLLFFGLIHGLLMLLAIAVITIGSAVAKRRLADKEKFGAMLAWYLVALIVIFIAIPWPFSPLAGRPYFR